MHMSNLINEIFSKILLTCLLLFKKSKSFGEATSLSSFTVDKMETFTSSWPIDCYSLIHTYQF